MDRNRMVWRKRRKPDGSYEWVLDTPDWYERELRYREFDRRVLKPAFDRLLDANDRVSRVMYGRLFPAVGKALGGLFERAFASIYDTLVPVPKIPDTPEARRVARQVDAVESFLARTVVPVGRFLINLLIRVVTVAWVIWLLLVIYLLLTQVLPMLAPPAR